MRSAKDKISAAVEQYARLMPEEFGYFKERAAKRKTLLHDSKLGAVKGDHVVQQFMYSLPETLHGAIFKSLTVEEARWFDTDAASVWFTKRFPVFAVADEV